MNIDLVISIKEKLDPVKTSQSRMSNLKPLYTNCFLHQKHFHCNTSMIHIKTISIHTTICVNICHANLSTKIHIIPLGRLKYLLS